MSFQIILVMWQFGLIDTFTAVSFLYNAAAQYSSIVVAALVDANNTKVPTLIFEPIIGFGVGYKFITQVGITAAERKARVATLAALLSASATTAATSNPAANAGIGGAIEGHIAHMREILRLRGGSQEIVKYVLLKNFRITANPVKTPLVTPLLSPAQMKFQENCKLITQNIFREHTARRYINGLAQKVKPTDYLVPIASAQINTSALTGWTSLGVGLIGLTTLGLVSAFALYLFQRAERKRLHNQKDQGVIDVTASLSD